MEKTETYTYFNFHFDNLGFEFTEKATKKVLTKLQVYLRHQNDINVLKIISADLHFDYKKQNSKGWEKGERLYCDSNSCEKRFDCYRYKQKKHGHLIKKLGTNLGCDLYEFDRKN